MSWVNTVLRQLPTSGGEVPHAANRWARGTARRQEFYENTSWSVIQRLGRRAPRRRKSSSGKSGAVSAPSRCNANVDTSRRSDRKSVVVVGLRHSTSPFETFDAIAKNVQNCGRGVLGMRWRASSRRAIGPNFAKLVSNTKSGVKFRSTLARRRPMFAKSGPNSTEVGRTRQTSTQIIPTSTRHGLDSAKFGPHSTRHGRARLVLARHRHTLTTIGLDTASIGPKSTKVWPEIGQLCPDFDQHIRPPISPEPRPPSVEVLEIWPAFDQTWPDFAHKRPKMARAWSNLARLRPMRGQREGVGPSC